MKNKPRRPKKKKFVGKTIKVVAYIQAALDTNMAEYQVVDAICPDIDGQVTHVEITERPIVEF
jgi:hypothetical protein